MASQPPRQPGDGSIEVKRDGEHLLAICETDGEATTVRMGPFNAWRLFGMLALFLDIELSVSYLTDTEMGELRSVRLTPKPSEQKDDEWWTTARVGAIGVMRWRRPPLDTNVEHEFVVVRPWDGSKIKLYGPRGQARYYTPTDLDGSYLRNTVQPDAEFRERVCLMSTGELLALARHCWGIDTTPGRIVHMLCLRLEAAENTLRAMAEAEL